VKFLCNGVYLNEAFELKRIFLLLFLLFYVASSYAISQERVRLIVSEIQHSSGHDDGSQVDAGCKKLRNGFPNYQRAKPKTICVLYVGQNLSLQLVRHVSDRSFHPHTLSFKSLDSSKSVLSRAPPSQS